MTSREQSLCREKEKFLNVSVIILREKRVMNLIYGAPKKELSENQNDFRN